MTLLMAPFDVSRQRSAAKWKYWPDESPRRAGKLPGRRQRSSSIVTGKYAWLWTLLAAALIILIPALWDNTASLFFRADVNQDNGEPAANATAYELQFDPPYALPAPRAFVLEGNSPAPISFSQYGDILKGKSLLGPENVALLDALQPARTQLAHAVQLNLERLRLAENPATSPNKGKPKTAAVASRLARVTVYWPEEADFYTRNRKSSTGTRLRDGHCAVDPKVIPYGSVVNVPGVGRLIAVDTGVAVKSRRAARLTGRTREQRGAIVIDVFCSTRAKARALIKRVKHFAVITWQRPDRIAEL